MIHQGSGRHERENQCAVDQGGDRCSSSYRRRPRPPPARVVNGQVLGLRVQWMAGIG
jgi:hypothetical protein